jgi:predicted negative regulator of RcsB-dependent stress response
LVIIFLLFAAVLIFGWFYLQRAKARDAATASTTAEPTAHEPVAEPTAPTQTEEPQA